MKSRNPMRRSWLDETEGGWVAHRLELMMSPAWRHRPVPLCNVLERLEIEHMRHGGQENGRLIVSYDQFVKHSISRKIIRPALQLGQQLGLLDCVQYDDWQGDIRRPNEYRLTYVPAMGKRAPTDEWAKFSEDDVKAFIAAFQDTARTRRNSTSQFPFTPVTGSPFPQKEPLNSSPFAQTLVTHGEPSLISGGKAAERQAMHAEEAPPQEGRERRSVQAGGVIPVSDTLMTSRLMREGRS